MSCQYRDTVDIGKGAPIAWVCCCTSRKGINTTPVPTSVFFSPTPVLFFPVKLVGNQRLWVPELCSQPSVYETPVASSTHPFVVEARRIAALEAGQYSESFATRSRPLCAELE